MDTKKLDTPIHFLGNEQTNRIYVKREDFVPFSFGGNKARKAQLFFEEIDSGPYDCVVTYGSSSSNHCRIIANMAAARGMKCYIISPEEASEETYNSKMMEQFGAEITVCPVQKVSDTIEGKLQSLRKQGQNPYFIAGGGHGNIGTQAFVNCYEEILDYEQENHIHFDYIFHASGTGTTQAGLVCGQLIHRDDRQIIGISIARKNPRGRDVVLESVQSYLAEKGIEIPAEKIEETTVFLDQYILGGYGAHDDDVLSTINYAMRMYGIPLDSTYTGKAFSGMLKYLRTEQVAGKNILFIHTGGAPLFFDYLSKTKKK